MFGMNTCYSILLFLAFLPLGLSVSQEIRPNASSAALANSHVDSRGTSLEDVVLEGQTFIVDYTWPVGQGADGTFRNAVWRRADGDPLLLLAEIVEDPQNRNGDMLRGIEVIRKPGPHPNIEPVFAAGKYGKKGYKVMEAPGQTLWELQAKGWYIGREERVVEDAKQMLNAVSWLHRQGISLGGLSMHSFMRNKHGVVKLNDFGFASKKLIRTQAEGRYKGPQAKANLPFDSAKEDVWALAEIIALLFRHAARGVMMVEWTGLNNLQPKLWELLQLKQKIKAGKELAPEFTTQSWKDLWIPSFVEDEDTRLNIDQFKDAFIKLSKGKGFLDKEFVKPQKGKVQRKALTGIGLNN